MGATRAEGKDCSGGCVTVGLRYLDGGPGDSNEEVPEELNVVMGGLIDGLRLSLSSGRPVVVEALDGPVVDACVLPFYLQMIAPDAIRELPIDKAFALVPFGSSQRCLIESFELTVGYVREQRRAARWTRWEEKRHYETDFAENDWEARFLRHRQRLSRMRLPSSAFLAVDQVGNKGLIKLGHRPVLGRIAERKSRRLALLVPAGSEIDGTAVQRLARVDYLLVDLQGARGSRTMQLVNRVLSSRAKTPTLIVVDGPTEYTDLGLGEVIPEHQVVPFTRTRPWNPTVSLSMIGIDRLQAERLFRESVRGLDDLSAFSRHMVQQAEWAWWTIQQTLSNDPQSEMAFKRWCAAMEQNRGPDRPEVEFFTAANNLLRRTAVCTRTPAERTRAVVNAACDARGSSLGIVARTLGEALHIIDSVGSSLGIEPEDLMELGIVPLPVNRASHTHKLDAVVCAGFYGSKHIHLLRCLAPSHLHFVVDPVEARWAFHGLMRVVRHLNSFAASGEIDGFNTIARSLECVMVPYLTEVETVVDPVVTPLGKEMPSVSPVLYRIEKSGDSEMIRIQFVDGSTAEVSVGTRVERLSRGRLGLVELTRASALEPGDEIVIVDEDFQASFSERLMKALDASVLAKEASERGKWAALTYAVGPHDARKVHDCLLGLGVEISYATVRSWLPKGPTEVEAIPSTWVHFRTLAAVVGLALSEEYLRGMYECIRRWRSVHRRMGRTLVRIIRAAYLGRLQPSVVRQVQDRWGFDIQELVSSAQLLTVDHIERMGAQ